MELIQVFDLIRFIPIIAILSIAAYQDYRTGHADNRLWIYAPFGLTLTIMEFAFNPTYGVLALESIIIATVCAFTLFLFNGWGAADAKALITIAASTPLTPLCTQLVSLQPIFTLLFASLGGMLIMTVTGKQKLRFLPLILTGYIAAAFI